MTKNYLFFFFQFSKHRRVFFIWKKRFFFLNNLPCAVLSRRQVFRANATKEQKWQMIKRFENNIFLIFVRMITYNYFILCPSRHASWNRTKNHKQVKIEKKRKRRKKKKKKKRCEKEKKKKKIKTVLEQHVINYA